VLASEQLSPQAAYRSFRLDAVQLFKALGGGYRTQWRRTMAGPAFAGLARCGRCCGSQLLEVDSMTQNPFQTLSSACCCLLPSALLGACSENRQRRQLVRQSTSPPSIDAATCAQLHRGVRAMSRPIWHSHWWQVVQRLVDVGTRVQAGQVLARLDNTDTNLAVQAATIRCAPPG
jgi:hypothetical protein